MYIYLYLCKCLYSYIYICIYTYTYICIYIYTHTYTAQNSHETNTWYSLLLCSPICTYAYIYTHTHTYTAQNSHETNTWYSLLLYSSCNCLKQMQQGTSFHRKRIVWCTVNVYASVSMYVYMYVCMYVCVWVLISPKVQKVRQIYIYIYTHGASVSESCMNCKGAIYTKCLSHVSFVLYMYVCVYIYRHIYIYAYRTAQELHNSQSCVISFF